MEPEGEVLERLLRHEVRYMASVAQMEETPCAWFLHSPEMPDYYEANRALRLRDDGRGPDAIAREIVSYYRSRGLTPIADVDAPAEAQGIGAALRRLGVMPLIGDWLLMRYAAPEPLLPHPEVAVRLVSPDSEPDARAWIETVLTDTVGTGEAEFWRRVTEREAHIPEAHLFLGYLDGRPAGACDLFAADGWGRIESVVTRPEYRRRGVASAVVGQALAASLSLGHTETYLYTEAKGAGERVYTRLGFARWGLNVLHRHRG